MRPSYCPSWAGLVPGCAGLMGVFSFCPCCGVSGQALGVASAEAREVHEGCENIFVEI